ncbi:hypothetical protein [Nannocystis pusilla]|uniref:Membrane protein 6-pyruvoyl-tetrahydropterin synthase-related domain-containing protein n=1 Tax=Nannocystis pusilla TaxID=889268 RepID=A0ABS7TXA6_9BACT|nr:hypothetical protein [Nannocystis pusilla]MBZ5712772.1 hypothetical protein [Nannocystis pusilla]
MSRAERTGLARLGRRSLRAWPFVLVTALGLGLLWPVPAGVMPLSADHTVHLTRAWLYGQQLASGHLVGWSPTWFFGFPLGELYPPLGDLLVIAVRVVTLGLLEWSQAYALAFTLVFLLQGWALLRCGRALGLGPLAGLVAAALALLDAGAYREGGWVYTVTYGVWPQALATSLAWLALAELALAARVREGMSPGTHHRHLALAALAAAGALLAHPMSLPMLALAAPLWLITVGLRGAGRAESPAPAAPAPSESPSSPSSAPVPSVSSSSPSSAPVPSVSPSSPSSAPALSDSTSSPPSAPVPSVSLATPTSPVPPTSPPLTRRERLAGAALDLALVLGLGLGLAAWWLGPMSAHRGYMASYGWLYAPLDVMLRMLGHGQWTQLMAPAAGWAALLGLLVAAVRGAGFLRFVALLALVHWLLASTDVFWTLRLDRLSAGFSHIQYQRFLTAAKPGLFLLAGAVVGSLAYLAQRTWSKRPIFKIVSIGAGLAAAGLVAWLARDATDLARRHGVGVVQTERVPGDPAFDAAYAQFLAWAAEAQRAAPEGARIAVRTDRNAHWFMDSPVYTGASIYKIGFTPGDNFVHKPESGTARVLDLAQARWLLAQGGGGPTQVAGFGPLRVFERPNAAGLARLDGPGELLVESADLRAGRVRVRVAGTTSASRLVFHVAGYPRWDLSFQPDGGAAEPVAWHEVPVVGDGPTVTPEQRLRGELRGGKALGDDGSEPTLIAAPARDGVFELRYARWRWFDAAGLLASLAALVACVSLVRSPRLVERLRPLARRLAHPAVLIAVAAAALVVAGVRWQRAAARERPQASARLAEGRAAAVTRARTGPLKTDMLIFPAVLADPRRPSEVVFSGVAPGPVLDAWFALDDDDAKMRRRGQYRVQVDVRPHGSEAWSPLADFTMAHRPDRQRPHIPVPEDMQASADLAVRITPSGDAPPKLGFDLVLADR